MIATLILGVALMGQNRPDYPRHHGQGLALAGQKQPYMDWFSELDGDFLQVPITLQRSIPLEAIDLEIRQQRSMVHEKQRVLDAARQLTRRGAIDPYVLEQATAEYRFHKTQEGERIAYRALEGYERDTSGGAIAPDTATAYTLLLDWLKRREAMAEAKVEFRSFQLARFQGSGPARPRSLLGSGRVPARPGRGPGRGRLEPGPAGVGQPGKGRLDRRGDVRCCGGGPRESWHSDRPVCGARKRESPAIISCST